MKRGLTFADGPAKGDFTHDELLAALAEAAVDTNEPLTQASYEKWRSATTGGQPPKWSTLQKRGVVPPAGVSGPRWTDTEGRVQDALAKATEWAGATPSAGTYRRWHKQVGQAEGAPAVRTMKSWNAAFAPAAAESVD
jgi:hypothetical protein